MPSTSNGKLVVASEEWCAFHSLGIPAIKARVDSGAKTSAIHAFNIQPFRRDAVSWVSFEVHPIQNNRRVVVRCESPVHDRRSVRSSSGDIEKRYVIRAPIRMGKDIWDVDLTLTNRDSMGFRMLLGREAMGERMLVDPAASFNLGSISENELERFYGREQKSRDGLKIGVLASNPDLYSNRRIMEAGRDRGHEMVFLNLQQCYMKLDAEAPEVHYRGGWIVQDLDAVIPRIRPSMTFYGCAMTRHFESMGVYVLNNAAAIQQSRDKLFALQLMLANGIDIPVSGFANSPNDTGDLVSMVGGAPLVVKLLEGAQGRGVVLAETKKAAESVINAFKSLKANLLVQEFISEAKGKDLRCFVIGNRVVDSIQREAAPGDFRANLHQGGSASKVKITAAERKLAIKAARTFGLKVAGVDIIRSARAPLLLEVNSSPGLEGIETVTGKDVAGLMIQHIEKAVGWKRELSAPIEDLD